MRNQEPRNMDITKHILGVLMAATCVSGSARAAEPGVKKDFDPYTETKQQYDARAQWFRDAKVGVFIHWNPSSLIGKEVSWCRNEYGREKYDALYKQFTAEKFDADVWAKLFHESGIRYAVVVPKHHDGFCMFDTKTSDYNVMHSPFGRDYVKEIAAACGSNDVRFGLYYSILDWWNPAYKGTAGADLTDYLNVFKAHMTELLGKYGPVGCIWFDGNWEASWTHAYGREMYAFVRRLQPGTLLGNRIEPKPRTPEPELLGSGEAGVRINGDLPYVSSFYDAPDAVGDYQAREMMYGNYYAKKAWDSCYNVSPPPDAPNAGWSWVPPPRPRPVAELANWIIQCIGRDGNALLGIGPRPDGTIDPGTAARLLELGDWLKHNSGAIYGTRGGPYLPGMWGASTRKGNKVFLFVQKWKKGELSLPALPVAVKSARLIAGGSVTYGKNGNAWEIRVTEMFQRPIATIVELTLAKDAMALPVVEVPKPKNFAQGKPVEVSSVWPGRVEKDLKPAHITDGNPDTLWAAEEKSREAWVTIDLQKACTVEEVMLSDAPYGRTQEFDLETKVGGAWQELASGSTIGPELRLTFAPVKARWFRLTIRKASDTPTLAEFQLLSSTP